MRWIGKNYWLRTYAADSSDVAYANSDPRTFLIFFAISCVHVEMHAPSIGWPVIIGTYMMKGDPCLERLDVT